MGQELPGAGDKQLSEGATPQGAEGGEAGKAPLNEVVFQMAGNVTVHLSADSAPQEYLEKLAAQMVELHPPGDAGMPQVHVVLGYSNEEARMRAENLREMMHYRVETPPMVHFDSDYLRSQAKIPEESLADLFREIDFANLERRTAALVGKSINGIQVDEVYPNGWAVLRRPRKLSRSERKLRKLKRMSGNLK